MFRTLITRYMRDACKCRTEISREQLAIRQNEYFSLESEYIRILVCSKKSRVDPFSYKVRVDRPCTRERHMRFHFVRNSRMSPRYVNLSCFSILRVHVYLQLLSLYFSWIIHEFNLRLSLSATLSQHYAFDTTDNWYKKSLKSLRLIVLFQTRVFVCLITIGSG